ncbi:MAG: hypothetical protein SH850_12325 [Planctomycetaceae bacterium]|nr:hypothetical protein [Planctomycetaceae bacterium]
MTNSNRSPVEEPIELKSEDFAAVPQGTETKFCFECGARIRQRAEICPKCGVRQPDHFDIASRKNEDRSHLKIPILISAISNIIFGLFWISTGCGIPLAIPMFVLCIFEFQLWSKADKYPLPELARQAMNMGIVEIVVGFMLNIPTLICGIIVVLKCSGMTRGTRK